ncbi:MAG: DUF983 domain-containing protein [Chitinophagales bacterium]|nr:DUF983 domain-containing protein [Chitinophagales bacterium]
MIGKGDKIYSIVAMKCPRCHEGKLWKSPLYKMKFYDMYDNCPVCGLKYEQEPGFWYGAMYMGYTFSSGALLIVMLVTMLVLKWELPQILTAVGITAVLGFTFNTRLSRSTWLNMMVSYNPNWKKQNEERERKKEALRAQGVNVDETSSLTSQGKHGFESDNKILAL